MTPTPEQLAALAARIMAVMPRTGGRPLDTGAGEVAILIGDLCRDTESAERLAEQLVRHNWRRWNFAEFRQVAERLATSPKIRTEADLRRELVPALFDEAEYQALHRLAGKTGHLNDTDELAAGIIAAEAHYRGQAGAEFDRLSESTRNRLLRLCREEFTARIKAAWPDGRYDRTTRPPFLDRNARDLAEQRIYRRLVCGESLYRPAAPAPPTPAKARDELQKVLKDVAHKKHL